MSRSLTHVGRAVALVSWLPLVMMPAFAAPALTVSTLAEIEQRLLACREDLLALAQARIAEPVEFQIAYDLVTAAEVASARVDAAHTLLKIYQHLVSRPDQAMARDLILDSFRYYAKDLALLIKRVQHGVTHTKVPGLALSGSWLRDDLRQLVTLLERPPLPQ